MEKYDVISVVGEGSYGLVMRCRHRESGQYVAIKKFLETEDDPTVRKMALREIRMLKKLRHENLVNMLEVFRRKKRFFLVFEYLEHTVLEELEARAGGLGFITSRKYCYQVLRALDFIHSHDVIHRDIKPENVLVSRLGVIKLCDFGFARPYAENETFTDYVATRWYRSPELLVGDPRYGKEVDIWAVGCLYAEMMTGEPLFPGESDIDQLFQIVRVIGKLNARHQILITRNTMFKGMKQEQNTSLHQLFPDWNRDCLDFLQQCLKMDGNQRPDTTKLLKHELFVRDSFLDNFLVELRTKLNQEMQGNPLLKRMPSYGSGRKLSDDKKILDKGKKNGEEKYAQSTKERINQIGISLMSSQLINNQKSTNPIDHHRLSNAINSEELSQNLASLKQYLSTNGGNNAHAKFQKPISINNLVFKDSGSGIGGNKYSRVLSAKPHKTAATHHLTSDKPSSNFDLQIQPPSPVQFQSLQPDSLNSESTITQSHQKRLSPVSVTNLSISGNAPQYFSQKRSSNILGLQQVVAQKGKQSSQLTRKRDRPHVDIGLMPLGITNTPDAANKDTSPRTLPPPPWLTGNLKVTAQGKTTQISKRGITDWKSVGGTAAANTTNANASGTVLPSTVLVSELLNHEFLLPNCPGATTSPSKSTAGNRKKLSPMVSSDNHHYLLSHATTPRNFSASSELKNET